MKPFNRRLSFALLAVAALAASGTALAQSKEEATLLTAAEVLDMLRGQPDERIPERLLQRAYGVAVIPNVRKVALIFGGRRGSGVLTVRDSRGRFTSPVFVDLTGGSFGFQIGAQETDLVLVFTTRRGIEGIADGKLTLGVGASAAAGPVGRQAEAAAGTNNAEVFAYSPTRGLFAGVAFDGTAITIDKKSNRAFYGGKDVLASDIMSGTVSHNSENARRFLAAVARSTGETADAAEVREPSPGVRQDLILPPSAPAGSEVRTFPMEDPAPGAEPPR